MRRARILPVVPAPWVWTTVASVRTRVLLSTLSFGVHGPKFWSRDVCPHARMALLGCVVYETCSLMRNGTGIEFNL